MQKKSRPIRIKEIDLNRARVARGKVNKTRNNLEPHESRTIGILANFGFSVETINPSNTPKSNNPDLLMLGTLWEMKAPISANENTIKKRFKKASKQANGRAIFDLTGITSENEKAEAIRIIINFFEEKSSMRRIIIIQNAHKILDISK